MSRRHWPKQVTLPGLDPIPIFRKRLPKGTLGYWDEKHGIVAVSSSLSGPSAYCILLHELLHVCESAMLQAGAIKRRPPHDFIHSLAPNLLLVLAGAGLWNGVTITEYAKWYATMRAPAKNARKRRRRV